MDYMQQTAFTKLSPSKCMNDILKMSKLWKSAFHSWKRDFLNLKFDRMGHSSVLIF